MTSISNFMGEFFRTLIYPFTFIASSLKVLILNAILFINSFVGNKFLSLFIFLLIINILLTPSLVKQNRYTSTLSKIQPEIERARATSKNKQEEELKILEVYKKHNFNPLSGFLNILFRPIIFLILYRAVLVLFSEADTLFGLSATSSDPYLIMPGISALLVYLSIATGPQKMGVFGIALPAIIFFATKSSNVGLLFSIISISLISFIQTTVMNRYVFKK